MSSAAPRARAPAATAPAATAPRVPIFDTRVALKTGRVLDIFKDNEQAQDIKEMVAFFHKRERKREATIRELKDVNHLQHKVIGFQEAHNDVEHKGICKGKRYTHKYKGETRTGLCVGYQTKPLILFDGDDKAKPFSPNQLIAAGGDSGDDDDALSDGDD